MTHPLGMKLMFHLRTVKISMQAKFLSPRCPKMGGLLGMEGELKELLGFRG
jgi:hypothetical protein